MTDCMIELFSKLFTKLKGGNRFHPEVLGLGKWYMCNREEGRLKKA